MHIAPPAYKYLKHICNILDRYSIDSQPTLSRYGDQDVDQPYKAHDPNI